jgi:hypothetical protein
MLLRGGATVIATTRFQSIRLCVFLRKTIYGLGTSFENSRIDFYDIPECGDFLQFYRAKIRAFGYLINNAAKP